MKTLVATAFILSLSSSDVCITSQDMSLRLAYTGSLIVTSYRSVREQTDDSPFVTSIGHRVHPMGMAISQDLLCGVNKKCRRNVKGFCNPRKIHYEDWVYVEEIGFKQVFDIMNSRHRNRADIWVNTYEQEKAFHRKYGKRRLNVYLVKEPVQAV